MTSRLRGFALLMAGCTVLLSMAVEADSPASNIRSGAAKSFDPDTDYFPDKVTVDYAEGFSVGYHGHYKTVRVHAPWKNANRGFTYVLVQRGTPVPDLPEDATVFTVPAERFVALSTTYLPHLEAVDALETLVGIGTFDHVYTPEVVAMIEAGKVTETGSDARLNLEIALDLEPDVVMTYAFGDPAHDAYPKLQEAGLPVAVNGEYTESSPLGRSEWMKFTALFLNRERRAQEAFARISDRYEKLAEIGRSAEPKPVVLEGSGWQGTWHVAGGNSYMAEFLRDAGADYPWSHIQTEVSIPLDLETVLDRARDADVWINTSSWTSLSDALSADERYALFRPLKTGQVYNRVRRVSETGGNDYWESGLAYPDRVLADLIKIFHPDLMRDHDFVYYVQLEP